MTSSDGKTMIVEFSVKNFMSIKGEVRLSLVARPFPDNGDTHLFTPELAKGNRSIPLVHSAAIYGPNGAGKTNIIIAFSTMQEIIRTSTQGHDKLPVVPFAFDPECQSQPSVFEIVFILDGVRYQYGFSTTTKTIVDEWLFAWPRGRVQVWFERNNEHYEFGQKLIGPKNVWKKATRPNALFLSTAVTLNSLQLKPIFDWFLNGLKISRDGTWGKGFTTGRCCSERHENGVNKLEIIDFLNRSGFSIKDIRIVDEKFSPDQIPNDWPSAVQEQFIKDLVGKKIPRIFLVHDTGNEENYELDLGVESHGTQRMFSLAGPWRDTLKEGSTIIMDELEDSLHPALVKFLLDSFHNPSKNKMGAQLIFTTHNTSILNQDNFRRDQIWFCSRNGGQETELFPLTEFHPRKNFENLERSYLTGRYGALPYFRHFSQTDE